MGFETKTPAMGKYTENEILKIFTHICFLYQIINYICTSGSIRSDVNQTEAFGFSVRGDYDPKINLKI